MEGELGPVEGYYEKLVSALEVVCVGRFMPSVPDRIPERLLKHRATPVRAFLAKMVLKVAMSRALVERVRSDPKLQRLCGRQRVRDVPSETTFPRAFKEFAEAESPTRLHATL